MLDAIDKLPKETEEAAVERREATLGVAGPWSPAGLWGPAASALEAQRVMTASMMMAPFAVAQQSANAARRGRALMRHWSEEAMRCRSLGSLIEVNRQFGERAMAFGAGEFMRFFEQCTLLGRAAAAPESFQLRDAQGAAASEKKTVAKERAAR